MHCREWHRLEEIIMRGWIRGGDHTRAARKTKQADDQASRRKG